MTTPKHRLELPPEAEPARDFIEALVARYESQIEELKQQVRMLSEQFQSLTDRLQKPNPRNSSVPPSSEHPHGKPLRKPCKRRVRKQGGQEGHKRHLRELVPIEQCEAVIPCVPESCRRCGGLVRPDESQPIRHQVWEIPPIQPTVIEYQLHRGHCACCGITTLAELPSGIPRGQCGPRLAAFTGLLMGHFRQSKRRASSFLRDLLNIPCSPAWTVKIQNLVSDALSEPYCQLQAELATQRQLYVDESPTKQHNAKAWLWVAVAPMFAVFGIFANRSRESLVALIGDYSKMILNCDRAKMYLDGPRLQWCWAHLKRDIQKLIESNDKQVRRLGQDLMRQEHRLFEIWQRYKRSEIDWKSFRRLTSPVRKEFNSLLLRGSYSGNAKLTGICDEILPRKDHLWTFLDVEGIEPTNNAAERALRSAVILRKLSFGTQSSRGSRYLERILSVSETCRLQRRNAYEYLISVMQAKFAGEAAPSLLPQIEEQAAAA